jgi:hypothetical protein
MRLVQAASLSLSLFVLVSVAGCASAPAGGAGNAQARDAALRGVALRAAPGDTVYLIQHHIRPERREQFESFVAEVLWPAFRQVSAARPQRQDMARKIRLLSPVAPDRDGNYTYTFVLDPYVLGEEYNILDVLREVYAEEEAVRHYHTFTETWARDFTSRAFVQARDPLGG